MVIAIKSDELQENILFATQRKLHCSNSYIYYSIVVEVRKINCKFDKVDCRIRSIIIIVIFNLIIAINVR